MKKDKFEAKFLKHKTDSVIQDTRRTIMQNKLQELTDKLYNEGLSKGKQEAEQILGKAKAESGKIVADARKEAEKIVAQATREAQELKTKAENDIKMASVQSFSAIRQKIENAIVLKTLSGPVDAAVNDNDFIKEIILSIVKAFNPASSEPVSLELLLPEAKKAELEKFVRSKVEKLCSGGIEVRFSKTIDNGFRIGPKEEGYLISFTDEDFKAIISEYLRPKTRKLLFGE